MDLIVNELVKILKSELPLIKKELRCASLFRGFFTKCLADALSLLDDELAQDKPQDAVIHQKKARTILTPFGEVHYQRRYYLSSTGVKNYFALDRFLEIEKTQRATPLLRAWVVKASTGMTARHEAEIISLLTPVSLSHQAVNQIVHEVGKELAAKQETEAVQAQDAFYNGTVKSRRKARYVIVTGDALLYKESGREVHHASLYRLTIHEGSRQVLKKNGQAAKNRRELINAVTFSSTKRENVFWLAKTYLNGHYDLRNTVVITNSDNGSGFTPDKFETFGAGAGQWIHQLDHFHARRKIEDRLKNKFPELQERLYRAVFRNYDFGQVTTILTTIDSVLSVDPSRNYQERTEVQKLFEYLKRNWSSLKPIKAYGKFHNPGGLGTSESGHRRYSNRLKGHGKYWSAAGARAQALIIDCVKNNTLEQYLGLPMVILEREKWQYDGNQIRRFLSQPQRLSEPHVGVISGKVELNGQRYFA